MTIYEYQVKKIYAAAGIPVLKGNVAYTPKEAYDIAKKMDCDGYIIKSQIPAYLRGRGHFVEKPELLGFCKVSTPKQVERATEDMLFKQEELMKNEPEMQKFNLEFNNEQEKLFAAFKSLNDEKMFKKFDDMNILPKKPTGNEDPGDDGDPIMGSR